MTKTPVLIAGPTASGKSALALSLAHALGGAIINCDSMQIYQGLRILTARPSEAEEAEAPHLLYGVLPPTERCSAGRYAQLAKEALLTCEEKGWRPIFVGGTGLYFRALTEGLSPIPAVPDDVRAQGAALCAELGSEGLHRDLQMRDPETAGELQPTDTQRLQRAWEVLEATGRGIARWQQEAPVPVLARPLSQMVLLPERDWLYARCDRRFEMMLEQGAGEEVKALMALDLDAGLPAMKALGVREIAAWQAGALTLPEATKQAQMLTRRYAKRQMTWMRNQMADWARLDPAQPDLVARALELVAR